MRLLRIGFTKKRLLPALRVGWAQPVEARGTFLYLNLMNEPSTLPAAAPTAPPPRGARSALLIVFLVVVVDLLGFGIVLPLLPITGDEYVRTLVAGQNAERWSGAIIGLLMASFSAMQFFFGPMWGRVS